MSLVDTNNISNKCRRNLYVTTQLSKRTSAISITCGLCQRKGWEPPGHRLMCCRVSVASCVEQPGAFSVLRDSLVSVRNEQSHTGTIHAIHAES